MFRKKKIELTRPSMVDDIRWIAGTLAKWHIHGNLSNVPSHYLYEADIGDLNLKTNSYYPDHMVLSVDILDGVLDMYVNLCPPSMSEFQRKRIMKRLQQTEWEHKRDKLKGLSLLDLYRKGTEKINRDIEVRQCGYEKHHWNGFFGAMVEMVLTGVLELKDRKAAAEICSRKALWFDWFWARMPEFGGTHLGVTTSPDMIGKFTQDGYIKGNEVEKAKKPRSKKKKVP